jgi:hypothetical protein
MIPQKTKYLLHSILGAISFPTIVWATSLALKDEILSGKAHGKQFICIREVDPLCYWGSTTVLAAFAIFFSIGAFVAWHDLLMGRRESTNSNRITDIFRSTRMVERSWVAILVLLAILPIALAWKYYAAQ